MKKLLIAAAVALASAAPAAADWAPSGPVKLLIAFAAGGGADTQARLIAQELETRTGWEFIPEQVTGKGGVNLLMAMKDMPNDGSVIGMVVAETLGYNLYTADVGLTPADFTAITSTAGAQMGIVVLSSSGWNDLGDMIDAAKGGQEIRLGTMSPRLSDVAYLLGRANGVEFNIIQVRGGRAVMNGVNAGDMDAGFMAGIQAGGVASGELVNLASAMAEPLKQSPEAPLTSEYGLAYDSNALFMFAGPGGMPDEARDALAAAIAGVASDPDTEAGAFLQRAFGGPQIIAGDDLAALLAKGFTDSEKLLNEVSQ